jgi:NAD dependent epimerase/dehydratase family enzyme
LGGKLGSGRQPFSWISIEDVLGAIYHCIHTHSISGPVNLVSPVQISNAEFNVILSEKLRKMGWFKTPSFVIKLVYGKMGKELLLQGSQVFPQKLTDTGYEFEYANLDKFLNLILEK